MKALAALLSLPLLLVVTAGAQELAPIPPAAQTFSAAIASSARPAVRTWITNQATSTAKLDVSTASQKVRAAAAGRFTGQKLGDAGLDALVLAVLVEQLRQQQQDIAAQLEIMKSVREHRVALRATMATVRDALEELEGSPATTPCTSALCKRARAALAGLAPAPAGTSADSTKVPADALNYAELKKAAEALRERLDSLAELGEEQQLRLQMLMERYQKVLEMLSNLTKKSSETQSAIIANLK